MARASRVLAWRELGQKGDILLKLRKVEIVGFKSFCDRVVVTFSGSGTTCIVGPNGCGKSNVVDAISWVLGEQSHKSLRAERMADCIFNGTTKRPPLGMAEVTITMEDPELAEAARFVLDGAPLQDSAAVAEVPLSGESAARHVGDSNEQNKTPRAPQNPRPWPMTLPPRPIF
jgi:ABC-type cobalamin/Fe3+-siderophores transport system ATPase subunit